MKTPNMLAALTFAILTGAASNASADPWKDESGHGRRGGYERGYDFPGRGHAYGRDRWTGRSYEDERGSYARSRPPEREFKEEYDDGRCKFERKLEKSGEYKEEVKCRGGRRSSYSARY